ncbi:MAG: PD-(D/E)XK nuclease family protein [Actinobacteria bacterium]|nr:PD-(D/E)XK nuclease family protein [Actinomycetota bacterium]
MPEPDLTPRQAEILDRVVDPGGERPTFPEAIAHRLREELEAGLLEVAGALDDGDSLFVGKQVIHAAHTCEGLAYARDYERFRWSLANARGTLSHRGVQRMIGSGYSIAPLDAVRGVLADLMSDDDDRTGLGAFLQGLSEGTRAELGAEVADAVSKFAMDWPRVGAAWLPRVETSMRVTCCEGRVTFSGKADLALFRPRGSRAGTLIVDLKSGGEHDRNLYDVRFYALLETFVRRVPPFRIAVHYLDSGDTPTLDVTEDLLRSEVRRVLDGVRKYQSARTKRLDALERTPSGLCPYCPLFGDCEPGRTHHRERSEL